MKRLRFKMLFGNLRYFISACFFLLTVFASSAFAISIDDIPPEIALTSEPTSFMIILDDSGSMDWSTLCPKSNQGQFNVGGTPQSNGTIYGGNDYDNIYSSTLKIYWRSRWSGPVDLLHTNVPDITYTSAYNAMAYNPKATYVPWEGMEKADVDKPKTHPNGSITDTYTLTDTYSIAGKTIGKRFYTVWSESNQEAYLVNLDGSIKYYKIGGTNKKYQIGSLELLTDPPPIDIEPTRTYAAELQNYANWYTYYRTRWLSAVGGITHMIPKFYGVKVGLYSINGSFKCGAVPVRIYNSSIPGYEDQSSTFMNSTTGITKMFTPNYGTPLRTALKKIGDYYENDDSELGTSPLKTDAKASCQQIYAMLFTDGYWNDNDPSGIGNADGTGPSPFSGVAPFADNYSPTLADVAMYYYKRDLRPALIVENLVPQTVRDTAKHQHMVTFTVGFGLVGSLNPDDYNIDDPNRTIKWPTWPSVTPDQSTTIDDLWHAAVNGRGQYLSAKDPQELEDAFKQIAAAVMSNSATAASVSVNGTQLQNGINVYQASFSPNGWGGELKSKSFNGNFTSLSVLNWSAGTLLNNATPANRVIATYTGTAGTPFTYAGLTSAQKIQLDPTNSTTLTTDIIDYIRGEHAKEKKTSNTSGIFRERVYSEKDNGVDLLTPYRLGDIVHSAPLYYENTVYVGANDGMLHAFDATTGNERFAYIPNHVFSNLYRLKEFTYNTNHKFFVDQTPYVRKISTTQSLLVGGLGKGGQGIYCLDISRADTITTESDLASRVKWEYPKVVGSDPDMGYSFSRPQIVKTRSSTNGGWMVVVGNGYNSANKKAVLYILNASDGSIVKKINTGTGTDNGLSTPVIIDQDADGLSDYIYAGDLEGNLWKFNINSPSESSWALAYGSDPVFTAKDKLGNRQPITSRPDAMTHCARSGNIVVFGTGRYLATSDLPNELAQTFYGIWDYGDDADSTETLGAFNRPNLSKLPGVTLLEQTLEDSGSLGTNVVRVVTNKLPTLDGTAATESWPTVPDGVQKPNPSKYAGWYFDLPTLKERIVNDSVIRAGAAVGTSSIPDISKPCSAGGDSWLYFLNACTGSRFDNIRIDVDNNRLLEAGTDDVAKDNYHGKTVSGLLFGDLTYTPIFLDGADVDVGVVSTATGVALPGTSKEKKGIFYWQTDNP